MMSVRIHGMAVLVMFMVIASASLASASAPPLVVFGYVTSHDGTPVEGALVLLVNNDNGERVSHNDEPTLVTDALGRFEVDLNYNNATGDVSMAGQNVTVTVQKGAAKGTSSSVLVVGATRVDVSLPAEEGSPDKREWPQYLLWGIGAFVALAALWAAYYLLTPGKE